MPSLKKVMERTESSFSRGRWGERQWSACISMLFARGYNDDEAFAIMDSKWPRWAADGSQYTRPVAKDLARLMDDPKNSCGREAVQALVEGK